MRFRIKSAILFVIFILIFLILTNSRQILLKIFKAQKRAQKNKIMNTNSSSNLNNQEKIIWNDAEIEIMHETTLLNQFNKNNNNYLPLGESSHDQSPSILCSELRNITLIGKERPKTTVPNITEIHQFQLNYGHLLNENGCYTPKNCIEDPIFGQSPQKLLIIIPYRDRPEHLMRMIIHLHSFLIRQNLAYCITVSEQSNSGKFNKGLLMNAAFVEMEKIQKNFDFNCLIFHDVDLLPENDKNLYICNQTHPMHLSLKIKDVL